MKFFGLGIKRSKSNKVLDVWFPYILQSPEEALIEHLEMTNRMKAFHLKSLTEQDLTTLQHVEDFGHIGMSSWAGKILDTIVKMKGENSLSTLSDGYATIEVIAVLLNDGALDVSCAEEAYLKLHMLSQRQVKPHGVNLNGAFGKLTNVAWTNKGPILPIHLQEERLRHAFTQVPLSVSHVDKFPYMVNYVIPTGVRVASNSQVRLGAYLGEGTTVMPAGYVNFNAGTLGASMVEGRVSAGVVVGDGTDIGGGASIMGTLSGGNKHVISVGKNCLIGANAGTGISLGDNCTIAAGLYVYAGKKVSLVDENGNPVDEHGNAVESGANIVKASALSGKNGLLFIEDSTSGQLTCKPNIKAFALNEALHQND